MSAKPNNAVLWKQTTTGKSKVFGRSGETKNYMLRVRGTGNVSATVTVYGSSFIDGPWLPLITLTATGVDEASDYGYTNRLWRYSQADVTAITGTDAEIDLSLEV